MKGNPMNIVILHGVLSREPEVRELPSRRSRRDVRRHRPRRRSRHRRRARCLAGRAPRPLSTGSWPAARSSSLVECAMPLVPRRASDAEPHRGAGHRGRAGAPSAKGPTGRRHRARRSRGGCRREPRRYARGATAQCHREARHGRHLSSARRRGRGRCWATRPRAFPKDDLSLPGPDFVDRVFLADRPQARRPAQPRSRCSTTAGSAAPATCRSCPVDQGIEHSARRVLRARTRCTSTPRTSSSSPIEGGCNAVASTFGVLGLGRAQVRAQDPVHRQAQPQRAADATRTSSTR